MPKPIVLTRLAILLTVAGSAMTSYAATATFNGGGAALTDYTSDVGLSQFNILVAGTSGTVVSINSVTVSLSHSFVGDTVIEFYSPDGANVSLAAPRDSESSNYNGTYTFVVDLTKQTIDEVSSPLGGAANIPSGLYAPASYGGGSLIGDRTNYGDFVGAGLDGRWSLLISDFKAGDSGALTAWSFNAT